MDNYPQNLIDQYLKASLKLKKFDRVVFKRFAPNVSEVSLEFARLAVKFEEGEIFPYAGMCHIGVAKCQTATKINESEAYLKAARAFLRAHNAAEDLYFRSNGGEYKEQAICCYTQALERCSDDSVIKAAIIRELAAMQPYYEGTSSFNSPAHRIFELEMAAHNSLRRRDYLTALHQLDDIVDNILERKKEDLYKDLLFRIEVLRLLLLVVLNLPPARQSPSHIKLIEYYKKLANFEGESDDADADTGVAGASSSSSGSCAISFVPAEMKYEMAEIILAWLEHRCDDLIVLLQQFSQTFPSLNEAQRFVLYRICENIDENN